MKLPSLAEDIIESPQPIRPRTVAAQPLTTPARVKLGILGLNFGRHIVEEIVTSSAGKHLELVALCDQNPERLASVLPVASLSRHATLDDLLADPEVEAVGLFTGPIGRADLMRKILRSGRHIITTKPLEIDPAAAQLVLEEADSLGLVVHCNSPSPLPVPDLRIIQRWEREYDLGQPVGARGNVWASYREEPDGTWYDNPEYCPAPPLYRLGIYLINDLVRLWGRVERVQVMETRLFTGRPTSDNAQAGLLFENGALANVFASFCVEDGDQYGNSLILNYENGTIYRNAGPAWSSPRENRNRLALVQSQENQGRVVAEENTGLGESGYQWEQFARAVRGESVSGELSPEQMVEGIRVIRAIATAVRQGGVADVLR